MGHHWDTDFRLKEVRKYLSAKVQQAQGFVYKLGQSVAGSGVDGVLKEMSLVPTIVSLSSLVNQHFPTRYCIECLLRAAW